MIIAEEIQYVTRQELLTALTLTVSILAVISGIIMAILKGSINMKTLSLFKDYETKTETTFEKVETEVSEIKENYLARFQKQYEMLALLRESMIEMRTEIKKDLEYIKKRIEQED